MESETQKINILMVDDNPNNLLALETILKAPDRNLVRASSGEEALRYLLDNDAAVILLDVHMPKIDGFETAELIRGRERTQHIPIIFLTAYNDAGSAYLTRGYSVGAVDYIIKPIDPHILRSKVAVFTELFRKTELLKEQTELLREQNIALENYNLQRLSRLVDLGQQLATERDPGRPLRHFLTSGAGWVKAEKDELLEAIRDHLPGQFREHGSLRAAVRDEGGAALPPPLARLPITSFLAAPMLEQGRAQGWLCLANKLRATAFSEAD